MSAWYFLLDSASLVATAAVTAASMACFWSSAMGMCTCADSCALAIVASTVLSRSSWCFATRLLPESIVLRRVAW
ncbi:hypothetical protein H4582DRAFT_1327305 [Lactarius indigo]|nr:hypothetical protein H4582DRAFT_1327305 [Lactarius indigo]